MSAVLGCPGRLCDKKDSCQRRCLTLVSELQGDPPNMTLIQSCEIYFIHTDTRILTNERSTTFEPIKYTPKLWSGQVGQYSFLN